MYVYILHCADGSYYVGVTNNVETRFNQHQSGNDPNAYTYTRRPVKLVFVQHFADPIQAIAFEKQVKKWSRKKKEVLIKENWEELIRFSKRKEDQ